MEGDATATATAADTVSMVLGEDLLVEIFLRLGFPNTLVHAAGVYKWWLHHIVDKAFLRRFRKLNPPRLLGFYIRKRKTTEKESKKHHPITARGLGDEGDMPKRQ
jgi:hypothetical protein